MKYSFSVRDLIYVHLLQGANSGIMAFSETNIHNLRNNSQYNIVNSHHYAKPIQHPINQPPLPPLYYSPPLSMFVKFFSYYSIRFLFTHGRLSYMC